MASLSQSSNNWMQSLKVGLISISVMCVALMLKLSVPALTQFAFSEIPSIWNFFVSLLRPPYLYVVINGIIITIVASSKLQQKVEADEWLREGAVAPSPAKFTADYGVVYEGVAVKSDPSVTRPSPELSYQTAVSAKVSTDNAVVYNGALAKSAPPVVLSVPKFSYDNETSAIKDPEFDPCQRLDARVLEMEKDLETKMNTMSSGANSSEMKSGVDEPAITKSSTTPQRNSSFEYSPHSSEKPPVSARFSHRKASKSRTEGGKTLGVAKPKRPETLESTWKTITEGRSVPLTRHLRKSDTWDTAGRVDPHLPEPASKKIAKSETFNDRPTAAAATSRRLQPAGAGKLRRQQSSGSWKLKREPSLSQDELNRRVEAFMNKFNEEMRLQRQESLNQYMEMINRGAH
ncbi:hypothetical protein NMG60_11002311 [Bertholletia excelsa]